ncbi:hypothetical protein CVT25_008039 [Psilocybe cyanescens]|uniref:Nephrocystin 3-like N-terminal domain-containing protein n=1 Tax=Psilocybe cyanescens TaxID=93625 RepID=A0A409XN13_PSICY|nr:hypothetical protein CVT25_008039 [Psilocybe cyanescens]
MDQLSKLIQETGIHDELIQELAKMLHKMLATAAAVPGLPQIPNTDNVIEEISCQSLQIASLIHEYTKSSFMKRTVTMQLNGIKSCIAQCLTESQKLEVIDAKLDVIKDNVLAAKINNWLSSPDTSKILNETDEKCQDGTCVWFLEGEQFLKWQESPGLLWVKGKVIKTLAEKEPHLVVAYFFFDGRDSQSALQLHHNLIRSLIIQFSYYYGGCLKT